MPRGSTLVLGKHSGRHAFKARLDELGYAVTDAELDRVFAAFKELADKKKEVDDRDLEALVAEEQRTFEELLPPRPPPGVLRRPAASPPPRSA